MLSAVRWKAKLNDVVNAWSWYLRGQSVEAHILWSRVPFPAKTQIFSLFDSHCLVWVFCDFPSTTVPVLCTGCPIFLIHFQPAFLKTLFSPVVPAVVLSCKYATHSLPFQCLRSLLLLVFIFPTPCKSSTCTIWLRRDRLSSIFRVIHIRLYSQPR